MRKAKVLPEPVCAAPRISRPCRARGIDLDCMDVGAVYLEASRPLRVGAESGRSSNFEIVRDLSCHNM